MEKSIWITTYNIFKVILSNIYLLEQFISLHLDKYVFLIRRNFQEINYKTYTERHLWWRLYSSQWMNHHRLVTTPLHQLCNLFLPAKRTSYVHHCHKQGLELLFTSLRIATLQSTPLVENRLLKGQTFHSDEKNLDKNSITHF